ncbi:MAG: GGDEF domain-containing protein, partial [Moraxellaceae bacterium]
IMMDIDHFKKVNDKYGHTVGDDVIRQVSRAMKEQVRDLDIAGRYGGEEFGVILTGTDAQGASVFAERLRTTIEKMVVISEGQQVRFTISMGIAQLTDKIVDHRAWIEKADAALYQSKEAGRNRFTIAAT